MFSDEVIAVITRAIQSEVVLTILNALDEAGYAVVRAAVRQTSAMVEADIGAERFRCPTEQQLWLKLPHEGGGQILRT